jgi:hypothetical protein
MNKSGHTRDMTGNHSTRRKSMVTHSRIWRWCVSLILGGMIATGALALDADRAQADTPAGNAATAWAEAQMGRTDYDGLCLQFVGDAYLNAGIDIKTQAGDSSSAASYWDTYGGEKHPPSEDPPRGALVFWGATSSNPYGHVVISQGGGKAMSSMERSYYGVHDMTIAYRDQQVGEQLGWIVPG